MDAALDISRAFVDQSRTLLTDSYLPRIEPAADGLSIDNWWRPNPQSNSIGNLILNLDGNVRQWIVSGLGGAPDVRERQREFDETAGLSGPQLVDRLRTTVNEADAVLANVDPTHMLAPRRIQTYDVTVLRAIYTVVEHGSSRALTGGSPLEGGRCGSVRRAVPRRTNRSARPRRRHRAVVDARSLGKKQRLPQPV